MSDVLIYTTDDGVTKVDLRLDQGTVWLTQQQIATLFEATKQNISLHLKNIFAEGELAEKATVKESLTVQMEGDRQVSRKNKLYNLDAILAVGYRVRSPRGVQFRRYASTVLKEYLAKGFVLNNVPICMAKTQYSFSDNRELLHRSNRLPHHRAR